MTENQVVKGLEDLYDKFVAKGDDEKAQETLLKIADLKMKFENNKPERGDILLG